ncbi:MAG: hypothetical protein J7639_10075 [Paenibacillaceae bacterium]|nr:hypothetical protein [Paenibacillaceae bacterium]
MKTMIFGLALMAVGIFRYFSYPNNEIEEWDGMLRLGVCAFITFVGLIIALSGLINMLVRSRRRDKMKLRELKKARQQAKQEVEAQRRQQQMQTTRPPQPDEHLQETQPVVPPQQPNNLR